MKYDLSVKFHSGLKLLVKKKTQRTKMCCTFFGISYFESGIVFSKSKTSESPWDFSLLGALCGAGRDLSCPLEDNDGVLWCTSCDCKCGYSWSGDECRVGWGLGFAGCVCLFLFFYTTICTRAYHSTVAQLRIKSEKADADTIEKDRSRWYRRQLFLEALSDFILSFAPEGRVA
jgi:hypothetical protein